MSSKAVVGNPGRGSVRRGARRSVRAPTRNGLPPDTASAGTLIPGVDSLVVLYGVPWKMYLGLVDALGECHLRHTYDRRTLEMPSVLYGVSWVAYEGFLTATADYNLRHTYDRGTPEMMSPLKSHEWEKKLFGRMIETLSLVLDIPIQSVGSTTFFRAAGERGLQPDESYYIRNEPRVRGRETFDPATDPPPDLVIEVDVTHSCLERLPVYATLRVPELWPYDGRQVVFYGLSRGAKYVALRQSKAFPFLRAADLMRFLDMRHDTDENSVIRAFVAWLREKHAPPLAKKPPRKT